MLLSAIFLTFSFLIGPPLSSAYAAEIPVDCNKADTVITELYVAGYSTSEMSNNPKKFDSIQEAVNTASSILKRCGNVHKQVTVRIGSGVRVGGLQWVIPETFGRLALVGEPGADPIEISERIRFDGMLILQNLTVKFYTYRPISVIGSLLVKGCTIKGRGGGASFTVESGRKGATFATIVNSTFSNIQALKVEGTSTATINIQNSKFFNSRIHINEYEYQKVPTLSLIRGNQFETHGELDNFIKVSRSNVTITENEFSFLGANNSHNEMINVAAERTVIPDRFYPIENMLIYNNRFKGYESVIVTSKINEWDSAYNDIKFQFNDVSRAEKTLSRVADPVRKELIDASCNYWGDLSKRDHAVANKESLKRVIGRSPIHGPQGCMKWPTTPTMPPVPNVNVYGLFPMPEQPKPSPSPEPTPSPTYSPWIPWPSHSPTPIPEPLPTTEPNPPPAPEPSQAPAGDPGPVSDGEERLYGDSRIETAVDIAQDMFPSGANAVIVARSDDAADSVSAVPFAKLKQVPILLTQSDTLHPATAMEIRRLMPKGGPVYIMGREVAIKPNVVAEIKAISGHTERLAGENRAGTAVETAKKLEGLGKLKHIMLTDGSDWQPDLIAGPAAAKVDGATLLTWGEKIAPETMSFLQSHSAIPVTAIGTKAAKTKQTTDVVDEADPTKLSMKVISKFMPQPRAVGFATTQDFADALTGGAHMAGLQGPLVLIGDKTPDHVTKWVKDTATLKRLIIYGGPTRINAQQEAELRTALKH